MAVPREKPSKPSSPGANLLFSMLSYLLLIGLWIFLWAGTVVLISEVLPPLTCQSLTDCSEQAKGALAPSLGIVDCNRHRVDVRVAYIIYFFESVYSLALFLFFVLLAIASHTFWKIRRYPMIVQSFLAGTALGILVFSSLVCTFFSDHSAEESFGYRFPWSCGATVPCRTD